MRNKEPYKCHELLFKLQTCGDDCAKLSFDGSAITLKMAELNYLLLNMGTIESQLARYTQARDVIEYVNLTNTTNADTFVQPKNGACNFVLYDILFEDLQNNTLNKSLHGEKSFVNQSLINKLCFLITAK